MTEARQPDGPNAGKIDIVSIFPAFLDVLELSLLGKARAQGDLRVGVHDLRDWTTDRHRTVDDTPAGGGAGMVMRPDVWGRAIDDLLTGSDPGAPATLVVPTPAGEPFTQRIAGEIAAEIAGGAHLIVACGRYEGIDARVGAHYAAAGVRVRELSIGDYVLNGGEVAAVVMIEAIGRLLPGVVGNPHSLVEESHGRAGLLEYPVYTAPAQWRGLDIPAVLRSGDHGRIERWRRARAVARTAAVRPDLLAAHEVSVRRARLSDAADLADVAARTFPLACPPGFPPAEAAAFVAENLTAAAFRGWAKARRRQLWLAEVAGAVVGYAMVVLDHRGPLAPTVLTGSTGPSGPAGRVGDLNKVYVLPEHHGSGVADRLLEAAIEGAAAAGMARLWLGVNQRNARAQAFYRRHSFAVAGERTFTVGARVEDDYVMERTLDPDGFPPRPGV
ncbi:tRNA (guanosine(37)-N1)-methyltransferase TrmD [Pseudactinotalea sp. HY158]|nr:tRNA (guanosine(37)-N1)-methyltransferase TrmD [Pseudactinotalea sp. HY158]